VRQNHRIIESDVCDPARAREADRDMFKSRSRVEAEIATHSELAVPAAD
jgi:hypothetical protein